MNSGDLMRTLQADKLRVRIFPDRRTMGRQAAAEVSGKLRFLLSVQPNVRVVFAAAPSQDEFLASLSETDGIDWSRVTAFHMDEYLGLKSGAEQLFSSYLNKQIFRRCRFNAVNYIESNPENCADECRRYSELLGEAPIDLVCLGIGENGHIAFNDPYVADFNDQVPVKVVELDEQSRQQQVNDRCFRLLKEVPERAITLTVPALLSGRSLIIVVPGRSKSGAVYRALHGKIDVSCPASVLRTHGDALLFLDNDSASGLS